MELALVTKNAEKAKWMKHFVSCYTGSKQAVNMVVVCSNICKFFVAKDEGKELGYIRLSNYSSAFNKYTNEAIWQISEAYVKPCYRSNGVLRFMIEQCVLHHNACFMRIEISRINEFHRYYESLGFSYAYEVGEELCLVFQKKIEDIAKIRNADLIAQNDAHYHQAA